MHITDDQLLCVVLVILLVLVITIGQKADANGIALNDNAGYKRPMFAFEMNAGEAPKMFKSWDENTKRKLREALIWDFLFLFVYPAFIATSCFIAARFLDTNAIIAFKYSLVIICLQLAAPIFDAAENLALLRVLHGPIEHPWPQIARWCAISKFSLIFAGLFYSLAIGGGTWVITLVMKSR